MPSSDLPVQPLLLEAQQLLESSQLDFSNCWGWPSNCWILVYQNLAIARSWKGTQGSSLQVDSPFFSTRHMFMTSVTQQTSRLLFPLAWTPPWLVCQIKFTLQNPDNSRKSLSSHGLDDEGRRLFCLNDRFLRSIHSHRV